MSDNVPLWTRNFVLISEINFQLVLIFYLLIVVIVGFAVAELGSSTAKAGLISGLFIVGTLFGRAIFSALWPFGGAVCHSLTSMPKKLIWLKQLLSDLCHCHINFPPYYWPTYGP